MSMRHFSVVSIIAACLISSCATNSPKSPTQMASNFLYKQNVTTIAPHAYSAKDPRMIAMYTEDKSPHTAYRIIGVASVSKYNLLGAERQQETMNKMMRKLAASIGGDGLINIDTKQDVMEGQVIQFQKILI